MAVKKQSKLGHDPLAWMQDEDGAEAASDDAGTAAAQPAAKTSRTTGGRGTKRATTRRKTTRKTTAKKPSDVELLERSFAALAPDADTLAARFYEELFERYPDVVPMFEGTDVPEQQKKLVAALTLVVNSLRKPEQLNQALVTLGKRHQEYGAEAAHYQAVADTLIDVMRELAGDLWSDDIEGAWTRALTSIAETMLNAYDAVEEKDMAANPESVESGINSEEVTRLRSALDNAMTAIMMVDRDLVITYANKSVLELLGDNQDVLREIYPGFDVNTLVGSCIDQFHKNPAHQRALLGDPANLPYSTDIHVGPLTFHLNTTAQLDEAGNYIGTTQEWSDVTEVRRRESEIARLQGTVDGAMTAIMMIDRDFNITYVNDATRKLLGGHEAILKAVYPGFSVENIVGSNIDAFHKNPSHQRQLLADPRNLPYSTDIHVGPLTFNLNVTAVHDAHGEYVGNALEWSDVTEMRAKEEEVARLQSAIDGASSNFMLCDEDLNIVYVNPAVVEMMRRRQNELREIWPSLDANNLVGQNIDQFHKNPAHQRALLSDPNRLPAVGDIQVAGLDFQVIATMITGPNGEYRGNMVEWKDQTEQKDAERQIEGLIQSAVDGQLDQRIDTSMYDGFMKGLGDGINSLMDTVVQPIKEGTRVLQHLASGDLSQHMEGEYNGEFAVLRDAIGETLGNLQDIVGRIRESSGSIATAAGEIAHGNTDLSQRTEEQASSLEETASSMEELNGTVAQNADNARTANQLALSASEQAEKGGDVVSQAITAMAQINDASKKIADIIGVIDEIAFQTNLLALNAAVEAARAGEQGRGFAVVATEVRNLAQRSAAAAKEIKTLIKDSVEKVDDGSRLVNDSGSTLEEIVISVKKVSDIIAEIAAASQEQSAGIGQVNQAITQMEEVTQQNAALVEQAAAASESLDEQAKGLDELMSFFGDTGGAPERPVAADASRKVASRPVPRRAAVEPRRPASGGHDAGDDSEWEEF